MLFKQTVSRPLLKILEELMQDEMLQDFVLVGGTSLSLRYGYRLSEDIDLFTSNPLPQELKTHLFQNPNRSLKYAGQYSISFFENDVKVDLAHWNMDLSNFELIEGIRMANPLDVFAMKFDAITTRKTKKDFVDIYELCKHFSFHQGFEAFNRAYPHSKNSMIMFTAFGEIDDADSTNMPEMLIDLDWEFVKDKLRTYSKRYFFDRR